MKKAFSYLSTKYEQFNGLFDDVDVLGHDGDVIGDAYGFLISQFASEVGKKAGEFYTPHEVSDMMARIVTLGQEEKKLSCLLTVN